MEERKIFTVDDVHFSGLNDYFNSLRDRGMRTIIILVGQFVSLSLTLTLTLPLKQKTNSNNNDSSKPMALT